MTRIRFTYLIPLLGSLLLAACTVFDHDLRDPSEVPGFDEVVHVETDDYTLDYQYQPTTRVFTDLDLSYVSYIDYAAAELYMNGATPSDVLPAVGQVLHHGVCDELPYGLCHRVTGISRKSDLYAIRLERAPLAEVFQTLRLECEVEDQGEYREEEVDSATLVKAGAHPMAPPYKADKNETDLTGSWQEFDILGALPNVNFESDTKPIKGYANYTGQCLLRWRPIVKTRSNIDLKGEKFDMSVSIGNDVELIPQFSGTAGLEIDVLKVFGLKDKLSLEKLIVPELSLWLVLEADAELDISFSGHIGEKFSKRDYVDFGGSYGVRKEDGVYIQKHTGAVGVSAPTSTGVTDEFDADLNFNFSLMAGGDLKLLFGYPGDYPNVGISLKGLIGPHLYTTYAGASDPYYKVLRIGIGVQFAGTLFLNIFKNVKLDWNFVDAILKVLGIEGGAQGDIPGVGSDVRFYPSIDNLSINCTNPKGSGTPEFDIRFDVNDGGMFVTALRTAHPAIRIYPHAFGSTTPIVEKLDFANLRHDKSNKYSWTLKSDKLQRDVFYDADFLMIHHTQNGTDNQLYSHRVPFTSTSPSAVMNGYSITAQTERRESKASKSSTSNVPFYKTYYDWKFRTNVSLRGRQDIVGWGFKVNGREYAVDEVPGQDNVQVLWQIKGSQKVPRTLVFYPFVKYRAADEVLTNFMEPYTVVLTYNATLNEYDDKLVGKVYYSGFDYDSEVGAADVDMSDKKL